MPGRFAFLALAVLTVLVCDTVPAPRATAAQPPAKSVRRALLVGVTKYPNLAGRLQLEGPANDVKLMKATLTTHFDFKAENVVTLSEADGAKNPELLPTRANIAREFNRLAQLSAPGDEVVILLGGHGSQQPESPNAKEPEVDGLDEIFLPRDVGAWSDTVGSVQNAIIDDDLGEWIGAIQKKNAFIWLIVDACHSGTMMRGEDEVEKPRKTDPVLDLAIPAKALKAARDAADKRGGPERTRGGEVVKPTALGLGDKKGFFALYAAQPTETTPERPMPPGGSPATQHGVLTFAVCQALTQAKAAGSPISYRELGQRIHQQYSGWGRTSPTPMVEFDGEAPDREVLGPGVWKDRAKILLSVDNGTFKVNAGQVLGLTPGSVLQVIPPAGMGEQTLGHLKVTRPTMLNSEVEPCEFDKTPAPKELPANARCKVVFVDYGEVQLKVSVATHYQSIDQKLTPIPDAVRKPLLERLKKGAKPDGLYRVVDNPKDAAPAGWLVTPLPDKGPLSLLPAAGWDPSRDPVKSKGYGPIPTAEGQMEKWLDDALGRIARAGGLLEMAVDRTRDLVQSDELAPQFKAEVMLMDTATGTKVVKSLPWPVSDLTVFDKDRVRVQITNTGRVPFDLTVLYADTDHAITPFFPKSGVSNRLRPKESVPVGFRIDGSTVGTEHVVVIAVKADGPETNFLSLVQKGPDKLRDLTRGDGPQSRMARLFDRQMYKSAGGEASRGAGVDTVTDHTMGMVSWQVKGTTRPKADPKK